MFQLQQFEKTCLNNPTSTIQLYEYCQQCICYHPIVANIDFVDKGREVDKGWETSLRGAIKSALRSDTNKTYCQKPDSRVISHEKLKQMIMFRQELKKGQSCQLVYSQTNKLNSHQCYHQQQQDFRLITQSKQCQNIIRSQCNEQKQYVEMQVVGENIKNSFIKNKKISFNNPNSMILLQQQQSDDQQSQLSIKYHFIECIDKGICNGYSKRKEEANKQKEVNKEKQANKEKETNQEKESIKKYIVFNNDDKKNGLKNSIYHNSSCNSIYTKEGKNADSNSVKHDKANESENDQQYQQNHQHQRQSIKIINSNSNHKNNINVYNNVIDSGVVVGFEVVSVSDNMMKHQQQQQQQHKQQQQQQLLQQQSKQEHDYQYYAQQKANAALMIMNKRQEQGKEQGKEQDQQKNKKQKQKLKKQEMQEMQEKSEQRQQEQVKNKKQKQIQEQDQKPEQGNSYHDYSCQGYVQLQNSRQQSLRVRSNSSLVAEITADQNDVTHHQQRPFHHNYAKSSNKTSAVTVNTISTYVNTNITSTTDSIINSNNSTSNANSTNNTNFYNTISNVSNNDVANKAMNNTKDKTSYYEIMNLKNSTTATNTKSKNDNNDKDVSSNMIIQGLNINSNLTNKKETTTTTTKMMIKQYNNNDQNNNKNDDKNHYIVRNNHVQIAKSINHVTDVVDHQFDNKNVSKLISIKSNHDQMQQYNQNVIKASTSTSIPIVRPIRHCTSPTIEQQSTLKSSHHHQTHSLTHCLNHHHSYQQQQKHKQPYQQFSSSSGLPSSITQRKQQPQQRQSQEISKISQPQKAFLMLVDQVEGNDIKQTMQQNRQRLLALDNGSNKVNNNIDNNMSDQNVSDQNVSGDNVCSNVNFCNVKSNENACSVIENDHTKEVNNGSSNHHFHFHCQQDNTNNFERRYQDKHRQFVTDQQVHNQEYQQRKEQQHNQHRYSKGDFNHHQLDHVQPNQKQEYSRKPSSINQQNHNQSNNIYTQQQVFQSKSKKHKRYSSKHRLQPTSSLSSLSLLSPSLSSTTPINSSPNKLNVKHKQQQHHHSNRLQSYQQRSFSSSPHCYCPDVVGSTTSAVSTSRHRVSIDLQSHHVDEQLQLQQIQQNQHIQQHQQQHDQKQQHIQQQNVGQQFPQSQAQFQLSSRQSRLSQTYATMATKKHISSDEALLQHHQPRQLNQIKRKTKGKGLIVNGCGDDRNKENKGSKQSKEYHCIYLPQPQLLKHQNHQHHNDFEFTNIANKMQQQQQQHKQCNRTARKVKVQHEHKPLQHKNQFVYCPAQSHHPSEPPSPPIIPYPSSYFTKIPKHSSGLDQICTFQTKGVGTHWQKSGEFDYPSSTCFNKDKDYAIANSVDLVIGGKRSKKSVQTLVPKQSQGKRQNPTPKKNNDISQNKADTVQSYQQLGYSNSYFTSMPTTLTSDGLPRTSLTKCATRAAKQQQKQSEKWTFTLPSSSFTNDQKNGSCCCDCICCCCSDSKKIKAVRAAQ